jgi:hypothetical protein
MRGLAQYAMSGRRQAIIAAFVCGLIPLLNMLTPAILALVLLRHGQRETVLVTAWAALPLVGWALMGDITPLILLCGVLVLASVLRQTSSWQYTLLAGILVGVGAEMALRLRPDFLLVLQQQVEAFLAAGALPDQPEVSQEIMRNALISLFGVMHMFMSVCLILLARWWQSLLFNPGGFQQEFHQIKLQPAVAVMLTVLFVLASTGVTVLAGWTMYFLMPLFFAGLALVHGLIGLKKLSWVWLIALYMLLLNPPVAQLLSVAALIDSWYDFRARVKAAGGPSS